MNKTRQQELTRWLKQQSIISRRWLMISRLLGVASGLLDRGAGLVPGADPAPDGNGEYSSDRPAAAAHAAGADLCTTRLVVWLRERVGFQAGQHIRYEIRRQVLDRLQQAGPAWIQGKPAGSWATLILEQIDDMHDYYARYLPQMTLAACVPLLIVITIFPINWAAALILLGTAPLIPLFMALVGMGAADANRRNFQALARLSGHFLGPPARHGNPCVFFIAVRQKPIIFCDASQDFRQRTMEVLRLAFLSSGVLEFFTSPLHCAGSGVFWLFLPWRAELRPLWRGRHADGRIPDADPRPGIFQPLRDLGTFLPCQSSGRGRRRQPENVYGNAADPGRAWRGKR